MTVYDVGSNIGLYTALAASRVGDSGHVVSVEPEATNCAFIRKTIARNGFRNVRIFEGAAGNACGEAKLFLCESNKADHRLYDQSGTRESVPVRVTTLDSLFLETPSRPVDVIKIDTQGSEPAVVSGMARLLDGSPNIKILMEFWPWGIQQMGASPEGLLETFEKRGFVIQEIDGDNGRLVPVPNTRVLTQLKKERQHVNLFLENRSGK
jgi:FkbM family methyltransferase